MKTSIAFYPNEAKKSPKTGKTPIYLRICMMGKKSETRLNAELSAEQMLKWDPMTMRIAEKNSLINLQLNRLDQKFHEFITLNSTNLPSLNPAYIKDYVVGNDLRQQKTVLRFVNDYYTNSVMNNVNRMPGTVKNYRRSVNHMHQFLTHRKQEGLLLSELTYEIAEDFKSYLVNSDPDKNRVGMTEVSASGVIKKFRTIFSQAVDKELIKKNPFKLVKIKTKSSRRERMTIDQVKQLWSLDLRDYPLQVVYRDIYLFSICTGLAYCDVIGLSWKNLENRSNGLMKLSLIRTKTDIVTESFLPTLAIEIANKYKNNDACQITGTVLPYRSNKELNSQLKFLAHMAKIPVTLSSHIARHTFRQLLAEAGIEDYGVIKRMMGQSRGGDVDEVYYSVTESRLLNAKNKFEEFLNSHLK